MKQILKKVIAVVVCGTLLLSLAACGNNDIVLKDNTLAFGEADYMKALSDNIETEYPYQILDTNIDTSAIGDYYVTFIYEKNGKELTQQSTVKVVDKVPPTIDFKNKTHSGDVYAFINDKDNFINNIILTDDCEKEINPTSNNIKIKGIIFGVEGENTVEITYKDNSNNTDTVTKTINVINPEMTLVEYIEDYLLGNNNYMDDYGGSLYFEEYGDDSINLNKNDICIKTNLNDCLNLTNKTFTSFVTFNKTHKTGKTSSFRLPQIYNLSDELIPESKEDMSNYGYSFDYTSSGDAIVSKKEKWSNYGKILGSISADQMYKWEDSSLIGSNIIKTFNNIEALENDEIIQQLGGLKFFFGKAKADIEHIKVNIKDKIIVSQ